METHTKTVTGERIAARGGFIEQMLSETKQWNKRDVPTRLRIKVEANVPLTLDEYKAFTNAVFCSTNYKKEWLQ